MKENDARLYVFAGKPAVAGAARSDDARAGTVGVAWIQLVSDRRNGARSDHGSFAAGPGFYGGRKHRGGSRRSLCAAGNTAGDSLVDHHGRSAAEGFFTEFHCDFAESCI